ncbi:MAG TPA: inositol 2-dehydrogenase [Blastocatellia bacterium]|nr:inositol 2-dehydrogenase [Blastocatellia bacterium]
MRKKLNAGIVGLGRLGSLYARYFPGRISNANLLAVAEVNETLAESFAREHSIPRYYRSYQDLVNDREIDAVIIVTPTSTHKDIIIAAAGAGKAVFCEKPLSISLDEAREIERVVADTGVFFHMGFMRRFDRGYRAAKEKIEQGVIGTPVLFKASSRDPFRPSLEYMDPRHSGGIVIDMGIHDIDLARWLMGEVASVYTIGGVLAYPEVNEVGDIDNAVTTLTFESGALGVIDLSRSGVYGYDIRGEILGTKGTLKVGYLRETPLLVMNKEGVTHDTVPYFMERFEQAYIDQLQNFIDNLSQGRPPAITCADGVADLEVAYAATVSFREKRPILLAKA